MERAPWRANWCAVARPMPISEFAPLRSVSLGACGVWDSIACTSYDDDLAFDSPVRSRQSSAQKRLGLRTIILTDSPDPRQ
jgi:hypothetical protein